MGLGRLASDFVSVWIAAIVLVSCLSIALCYCHRHLKGTGNRIALSVLLLIVPMADLALTYFTFVGGRGHPTVQLSLHAQNVWKSWFYIWPVLVLASLCNLALPLTVCCLWCRSLQRWSWSVALLWFASQVLSLLSVQAIAANFPDA